MAKKATSNIQFMGEANALPDSLKQNILHGVAFTSRWYQNRPGLTDTQRAAVADLLQNLRIYCSADPMTEVANDIVNGTLKADRPFTQWCKEHPGQIMENQEQTLEVAGGYVSPLIKDPVVMICSENLLKAQNIALGNPDSKDIQSLMDFADIVSHELAHLVDFKIGVSDQLDQYMTFETNHATDPYWDNNKEIYARLANFRQNFHIDPTHVYTEEEVFDLRMHYIDEVIQLQKELQSNPTESKTIDEIDRFDLRHRSLDQQLFERYTDQEIRDLLNNTAYGTGTRDLDSLDNIHAEAVADQPQVAQVAPPPTRNNEQTLTTQHSRGFRI